MQHRVEARQRWTNAKDWKSERRQRTRHLIELGGLVQKAGLVELANDDRAILFGAFHRLADALRSDEAERFRAAWIRRGLREFGNEIHLPRG